MTDGERRLWLELKEFRKLYGLHVRKQVPIGHFIVDFAIQQHKLVIEVDGEHHFTPEGIIKDGARDAWLEGIGYQVLRFNTGELSDSLDGCIEEILDALGLMSEGSQPAKLPPPLTPPLKGEGDSETFATPSPLWGGVRGGGNLTQATSKDI